jgi:putative endonuclease
MAEYFVYILASGRHGTLYIGVTSDLPRRLAEHRAGTADAFTSKYKVHRLVHVEKFETSVFSHHPRKTTEKVES